MTLNPRLTEVKIQGYRPFRDFTAPLESLEVLVGANGSGKSSLFEFLKFLRDSIYREIPPEIISGSTGQQIFHHSGAEKFGSSGLIMLNCIRRSPKSLLSKDLGRFFELN